MGYPHLQSMPKALPARLAGLDTDQILGGALTVGDLWTPALVLSRARLRHNARWMADWCARAGVELMPHGKTTMAPQLWDLQLRTGATGLTVATPWQLLLAWRAGVPAIQLANQLVDEDAIRWLAHELAASGELRRRVWSWVDDVRAVARMERALADAPDGVRLEVLVDLGRPGARTGARTLDRAVAVARAVAGSPHLRLAGVAGYEGALAHSRTPEALATVDAYLADLIAVHDAITPLYDEGDVIVSTGGSAYPDAVATAFAAARAGTRPTRWVLRSGSYLVHDDGIYRTLSPFEADRSGAGRAGDGLLPAARGVTRVVSQPEPGLALLDGGKRDFPYDEGLPTPLALVPADSPGRAIPLPGATITNTNDQHAFLRVGPQTTIAPGDVVVLGLSHPCTMFDKWRRIPVVEDFTAESGIPDPDSPIVGFIDTYF